MPLDLTSPRVSTGDGFIEEINLDAVDEHPKLSVPVAPRVLVHFGHEDLGEGLSSLLTQGGSAKDVVPHLNISLRSRAARLGFDVAHIHIEDIRSSDSGLIVPVDLVFKPGQDREGNPVESPLPEMIDRWLRMPARLGLGRVFFLHPDAQHLSEGQVYDEIGTFLDVPDSGAQLESDGSLFVPASNTHFPLRFDLANNRDLFNVLLGSGRVYLEERVQPEVQGRPSEIPPHGFLVASMRYSAHDLLTVICGANKGQHSESRIIDGNISTGPHPRHLEVFNNGDAPLSTDELGVRLHLYPARNGKSVVSRVASHALHTLHREGLNMDLFLSIPEYQQVTAKVLRSVENMDGTWGVLVGKSGTRPIAQESHPVHQAQAALAATDAYWENGGDTDVAIDGLGPIQEYISQLGDPRKRLILFSRELPYSQNMREMMDLGVQTVVTSNISRTDEKFFMHSSLLSVYRRLAREGLWLYWLKDDRFRRLWNHFFVDVDALECMKSTELVLSAYCSSVEGTEEALGEEFVPYLEKLKLSYPQMAFINGAMTGLMAYLNARARELGITTVGVGTEIPDQEPDFSLDACVFLRSDDFMRRQDLISRSSDIDTFLPGGFGTNAELGLETALRKIGAKLSPVICVDPVGLGEEGGHLWQPARDQAIQFTKRKTLPSGAHVVLAKNRGYLRNVIMCASNFEQAFQELTGYVMNPEAHWEEWGVPEHLIEGYLRRKIRDARHTGFQVPQYYHSAMEQRGIPYPPLHQA